MKSSDSFIVIARERARYCTSPIVGHKSGRANMHDSDVSIKRGKGLLSVVSFGYRSVTKLWSVTTMMNMNWRFHNRLWPLVPMA